MLLLIIMVSFVGLIQTVAESLTALILASRTVIWVTMLWKISR